MILFNSGMRYTCCRQDVLYTVCCILWWDVGCALDAASCGRMLDAFYMLHPVVKCRCTICVASCGGIWDALYMQDVLYMLHPVVGCGMHYICCILWWDVGCALHAATCGGMRNVL